MSLLGDIFSYFGVAGSTVQDIPGTTVPAPALLRRLRCDIQGYLQVLMAPGGLFDVNLVQVAGNAVVTGGVVGSQGVGGLAADGAAVAGNPNLVGGADVGGVLRRLLTDALGSPTVVGTQLAETAADDGTWPVKVAALVRAVLVAITDGQVANLLSDTYGRLWTRTAGYDALLDAVKTAVTNTIATDRDEAAQVIANATDPAGATNYPSDAGIETGNRSFLSWVMGMRDGHVDFQVSEAGTNWVTVTKSPVDCAVGTNGFDNTHYAEPDVATVYFACDWERCGHRYIRWRFTPNNATSIFTCLLIQRAL